MNREEISSAFASFDQLTALVIGDVMIDAYYWGNVDRISPEAPVPIVHVQDYDNRLGGAANVARNLLALGATPIICSVIGQDEKGQLFHDLLDKNNFSKEGILNAESRTTTVKTRVIADGHHMLRIDEENNTALNSETEDAFLAQIKNILDNRKVDVIILEDYNKGVLSEKVIRESIKMANERAIPSTVDPKKDNFFAFENCSLFKPNLKELKEGVKIDFDKRETESLVLAIEAVERKLKNKISLTTLSELGVIVKEGDEYHLIPAHRREILDVSGAGDTVISVASLCLAMGMHSKWIAAIANLSGGLVCEKVGVVPIDKERLLEEALSLI